MISPGALKRARLPRTLVDTLDVARLLHIHFVWIDSLCIVQNDPEDQAQQIPLMRDIYSRAVLTVVAACGRSADSGLAGTKTARAFRPESITLKDMCLLTCCKPARSFGQTHVSKSVWNSRAWTMQEKLLSRRCLIFTDEQVWWQCHTTICCEETRLETGPLLRFEKNQLDPFFLDLGTAKDMRRVSIGRFEKLVAAYTERKLSHATDAMNAFVGVLDVYKELVPCFWGTPIPTFASSLCWYTSSSVRTRPTKLLPSWSWLTWENRVDFVVVEQVGMVIQCSKLESSKDGKATLVRVECEDVPEDVRKRDQYRVRSFQNCRKVSSEDLDEPLSLSIVADFHILFWASTACFQLGLSRVCHDTGNPGSRRSYHFTEVYQKNSEIGRRSTRAEVEDRGKT